MTERVKVLKIYDTCKSSLISNVIQYLGIFQNLRTFGYSTVEHSCSNYFCKDTDDITRVFELLPIGLQKICLNKCILLSTYNFSRFKTLKHFEYSYPNCLSYELEDVVTLVVESLPETIECLRLSGQSLNTKFVSTCFFNCKFNLIKVKKMFCLFCFNY